MVHLAHAVALDDVGQEFKSLDVVLAVGVVDGAEAVQVLQFGVAAIRNQQLHQREPAFESRNVQGG